jgi:sugar/nucleoside kinase (ribokinase family)
VQLARAAHVLFPSEGELAAQGLDEDEPPAPGVLVCHTRGAAGAVLARAGAEPVAVPAPRTAEVDATGAGDTFAAAFVTALRAGADPVAAAEGACAVAARSVGVLGAMEAPVVDAGPVAGAAARAQQDDL